MKIDILYQDQDVTVIAKPSGLVVNRADTVTEPTVQDWFAEQLKADEFAKKTAAKTSWQKMVPANFANEYGSPEEIFAERGGIVHRLDKETSGVLVLANNPGALVELLRQFREREVAKMYTCLAHGKFQILEDTLQLPLGRSSQNRTKFTLDVEGRLAETHYKVTQFYPKLDIEKVAGLVEARSGAEAVRNLRKKLERNYQGFSLVQCWPKTGRTHQIRVHMSTIQHPLVSDNTYLGKKRHSLDNLWCSRLFLHASELEFAHPRTGEKLKFELPLPAELEAATNLLLG